MLADSAAGRADRLGDRDPLRARGELRRGGRQPARAPRPALRAGRRDGAGAGARPAPTPGPNYLDQRIIDTPHYNRLRQELGWVAQRNNTWSLHVHMGVRGADRAIAVCDWMRELLPLLLAVSANSPFLDRRDTGLHTVRTEIFTRTFPRCGVPSPFGDWKSYAEFVESLERTGTVVESTQLWWSVRPHHAVRHGRGADLRRADPRRRVVRPRRADRRLHRPGRDRVRRARLRRRRARRCADREIEENLWRAIRHGMSGELIDFRRGAEVEARAALEAAARLDRAGPLPARDRGRAAGAQRRPARPRGARRRRLDRGHLPRRGARDEAHLHRREAGGVAPCGRPRLGRPYRLPRR